MCSISSEEETIEHPDSDPNDEVDDSWTERILHITISAKTADEMRTVYHFSDYQNEALDALLSEREAMSDLHCFKIFRRICLRSAGRLSAMP